MGRSSLRILKSRWGQRALAAGAVVLLVALGALGGERWARRQLREAVGSSIASIHKSQIAGLRLWAEARTRQTRGSVKGSTVRTDALAVLRAKTPEERKQAMQHLHDDLAARALLDGTHGFLVVDPAAKGYAFTTHMEELGGASLLDRPSFRDALKGETTISQPVKIKGDKPSGFGDELPSMFSFAPIYDDENKLAGVLGFRLDPAKELSQVLEVGRMGQTGETYAFDLSGVMVSRSRFADQLRNAGLITGSGVLEVQLKAATHDVEKASDVEADAPQTLPVRSALAGKNGQNIEEGWLDYRGHRAIGSWTWIPEMRLGLVTKIDRDEAYAIINAIHWAALALIAMLGGAGVVIIVFAFFAMKLEAKAAEMVELGQYKLLKKIGEGGMGAVYRAEHSLLARPTAIKLLKSNTSETLQRFEREVKLTAQLSHPNTIAIYDYGFNDAGTFYYAMEFLEGTDLEGLVRQEGPVPVGRALHIVQQVLGSLAEAHAAGLVHRDIKPANIMLTTRGGIADFVKVLDFGLVRPVETGDAKLTGEHTVIGTPLYLAPELLTSSSAASARSDLYAVGAVLFYLLSGRDAFEAPNMTAMVSRHLSGTRTPLASVIPGGVVPEGIDELLSSWLARDAAKRPENARVAQAELAVLVVRYPWSEEDARAAAPHVGLASAQTELALPVGSSG
ncbi:MAG TPA: serine/threonine protein kinase [Polyangiaceae bacterium]